MGAKHIRPDKKIDLFPDRLSKNSPKRVNAKLENLIFSRTFGCCRRYEKKHYLLRMISMMHITSATFTRPSPLMSAASMRKPSTGLPRM